MLWPKVICKKMHLETFVIHGSVNHTLCIAWNWKNLAFFLLIIIKCHICIEIWHLWASNSLCPMSPRFTHTGFCEHVLAQYIISVPCLPGSLIQASVSSTIHHSLFAAWACEVAHSHSPLMRLTHVCFTAWTHNFLKWKEKIGMTLNETHGI